MTSLLDRPFFKRSEFYVAVVLPYVATISDALHAYVANGSINAGDPTFSFLLHASAVLSGIYAAGRALQKTFGGSAVTAQAVEFPVA